MATDPRPHPPHALLDALAPFLTDLCDHDRRRARLVRAREGIDSVQLGVMELPEGCHPSEVLTGMVVPEEWSVAGVLAVGTAHDLEDHHQTPVGLAYLLDRAGGSESRLVDLADGTSRPLGGGPVGLLPDLLHRALALPTPPPDTSVRAWLDLLWLDRLVVAAALAPGELTDRGGLRALHPLHHDGELGAAPSWEALRHAALTGDPPPLRAAVAELIDPELAAWHDEGSLSRALVAELPPRPALLAVLDDVLPPPLRRVVRDTCSPCPRGVPDRRIRHR